MNHRSPKAWLAGMSLAAFMAHTKPSGIKLTSWAKEVSNKFHNVVFESFIGLSLTGAEKNEIIAFDIGSTVVCKSQTPMLEPKPIVFEKNAYTFAIILAFTQSSRLSDAVNADHVVQVYAHRSTKADAWKVTVCDPNWSGTNDGATYGMRLNILGAEALSALTDEPVVNIMKERAQRIEIHRCLNVNVCVPSVGKGICFTGVCAALQATALLTKKERHRASSGDELMGLIFEASARIRPSLEHFVTAYHIGRSKEKLTKMIPNSGRTRSESPVNIRQRYTYNTPPPSPQLSLSGSESSESSPSSSSRSFSSESSESSSPSSRSFSSESSESSSS
jgi:hypothetical protein